MDALNRMLEQKERRLIREFNEFVPMFRERENLTIEKYCKMVRIYWGMVQSIANASELAFDKNIKSLKSLDGDYFLNRREKFIHDILKIIFKIEFQYNLYDPPKQALKSINGINKYTSVEEMENYIKMLTLSANDLVEIEKITSGEYDGVNLESSIITYIISILLDDLTKRTTFIGKILLDKLKN